MCDDGIYAVWQACDESDSSNLVASLGKYDREKKSGCGVDEADFIFREQRRDVDSDTKEKQLRNMMNGHKEGPLQKCEKDGGAILDVLFSIIGFIKL